MRTSLIIALLLFSLISMAQRYKTREVISTARSFLKDTVGPELINYFELDSNSYYEYRGCWGKTKWEAILHGKKTKGDFVNSYDIRFTLKHPDFLYAPESFLSICVKLDSDLNLSEKINLKRVPDFLLADTISNWLRPRQIDSVVHDQNLKASVKPLSKHLTYDYDNEEYYWVIINTVHEGKCYSDCEVLHINPVSGKIRKHSEARLFVMHCH